jgi:GH24 family phage-related lysozyme (muramidase)
MKPSQQCIDLIKSFEGLSLKAYRDPGSIDGRPITIGWGTTNYLSAGVAKYGRSAVMLGDTLTAEEAEQELQANIARYAKFITGATNKLNQNQFDAAVSFAYNTGANTRQITRLQSGAIADFRRTMPQYNKGGDGRVMPGLVRRRKAETDLWDGITGDSVQPTWINLVRHYGPEYHAYLMDGGNCVEIKQFKTREDLLKILQDASTVGNVAIGVEGWHVKPGPVVPPSNPLSVPYYSQRDYGGPLAWSICGCTSVAMVLSYWGVKIDPDGVLKGWGKESCQSPPGCEGVFEANKLKASHTYKGTWKEIRDQIDQGRPVVIHGRFTGSGHIIVIIGYDEKGYWCNDPAGKWAQVNGDSYADNPKNGAKVYYKEEAMWAACGGDGDVWYSVAWSK